MKKSSGSILLRVLLSVGLCFLVLNSVFSYLENPSGIILSISFVCLLIQMFIGFAVLLTKVEKKGYQFFLALLLIGWGVLNYFIIFIFPSDEKYRWPLYLISAGVFLFISGLKRYKKLKFGYVIPSSALLCMGVWYSLFSFSIVKIPFRTVVLILGPLFIVLIAVSLVLFFLAQQRHKELVIHDDSGDFGDEEFTAPKID